MHAHLELATSIVSAYVSNNSVQKNDLPDLIRSVSSTLVALNNGQVEEPERKPAVPIKRSITPEYIVCLEDGKKLKMLKRYLRSNYDLTPDQYRTRWNLPRDYPMVAPNYSVQRSEFAKKIGLGRAPEKKTRSRH